MKKNTRLIMMQQEQNLQIDEFAKSVRAGESDDVEPFFNVYRAVAMSATAILGWRSCLNHGENFKIPDFRDPEERNTVRDDDLTPFPDENGNGATLPCALPVASEEN